MKKSIPRFTAVCSLLLALTAITSTTSAQTNTETGITEIPKVTTAPVIDGEIDQIWNARPAYPITIHNSTAPATTLDTDDFYPEWYAVYDTSNFYLLIDIQDNQLGDAATNPVFRDRIEVYFNITNDRPPSNRTNRSGGHNAQYTYHWGDQSPNNATINGTTRPASYLETTLGIEWEVATTETGWRVEIRYPWTALVGASGVNAVEGHLFGFDVYVHDNDGEASNFKTQYNWWNTSGTHLWTNINGSGTLELGALFDGNFPPTVEALPDQIAFEGTPSNIVITGVDPNAGDELTFTSEDLPTFASLTSNANNTATVTVNAQPGDAGFYTFTVVATDEGGLQGSEEFSLIVRDPNAGSLAPDFDPIADLEIEQGELRIIPVTVTDADSVEVTIAATELPAFATFEPGSGMTGTLRLQAGFDVAEGDYTVTLVATDEDENTDSLTFVVSVVEPTQSGEFYVDPVNGSMENSGASDSPWSTLEAVFDSGRLFRPGEIIYLRSGYHGKPEIGGMNEDFVYIMPEGGAEPTLGQLTFLESSSHWDVSGLAISPSLAPSYYTGMIVTINGSNNVLADSDIYSVLDSDSWTEQQWLDLASDGVRFNAADSVLEDCTILNTRWSVQMGESGTGSIARGNVVQHFANDAFRVLGDNQIVEYNYIAESHLVDGNHDDGIQSYSVGVGQGTVYGVQLRGNVIVQSALPLNERKPQRDLQGIGLFDGMFEDWLVENNVVVVNAYEGLTFLGATNCTVINNTVVTLEGATDRAWIKVAPHKNGTLSTGNIVRNNIAVRIHQDTEGSATMDNNSIIHPNDYDDYFVDFPNDMRLKEGSPAIDAGSNTDAPTVDADQNPRPVDGDENGSAVTDRGAYEFQTAPETWRGHPIIEGYANAGIGFMGWVYVLNDPWLYVVAVSDWAYQPEEYQIDGGAFAWFFSYGSGDAGYFYSEPLKTWIYKYSAGSGGWVYIMDLTNQ